MLGKQAELLDQVDSTRLHDKLIMIFEPVDDQVESLKLGEVAQADVVFGEFLVASQSYACCSILRLASQESKAVRIFPKIEFFNDKFAELLAPVLGEDHEHVRANGILIFFEASMPDYLHELEGDSQGHLFVRLSLVLFRQLIHLLLRWVAAAGGAAKIIFDRINGMSVDALDDSLFPLIPELERCNLHQRLEPLVRPIPVVQL